MEEQAVDEAESPTVEEGDDVVRIMSIHAAKGLEFPIVVMPDLARWAGGGTAPVLLNRVQGEAGLRPALCSLFELSRRPQSDGAGGHRDGPGPENRADSPHFLLYYLGWKRSPV